MRRAGSAAATYTRPREENVGHGGGEPPKERAMILVVDIGNTETVLGVYRGLEALRCWRLATDRHRTGDELALVVESLLRRACSDSDGPIRRALIASVVPVMDRLWEHALGVLEIPLLRIDGSTPLPVRLDVEDPASVGADRIANTLAAKELYARNTVVVDLGTATTFDCITADGVFLGGVIAPGPRAGIDRLAQVATHLPSVQIRVPEKVIGRRTVSCLDSGVFYSIVDAIDGIVSRILEEWKPADPLVIATGGLADLVAPHCRTVHRVEPFLTLTGLACADRHLHPEGR
ncbi:MAG: type III pantothenate kinase [Gemmatimonadota bacterium]